MMEIGKKHGVLFWILVVVGSVVVLFFGSAMVAGIMESNERKVIQEKAKSLSRDGLHKPRHRVS